MNALKHHFTSQPFVFSTAVAAFIHSASILFFVFGGRPLDVLALPDMSPLRFIMAIVEFLYGIIPAVLIAASLDIGQINTSARIKAAHENGSHPLPLYLTFFVMAASTYYLQWLYLSIHAPFIELARGVQFGASFANTVQDLAVWLVPALLPAGTLLYTFSADDHKTPKNEASAISQPENALIIVENEISPLPVVVSLDEDTQEFTPVQTDFLEIPKRRGRPSKKQDSKAV